jgi:hypothetical protein
MMCWGTVVPKLKEPEVREGSMSSAARELDFASKTESVIHTSTKKQFIQASAFSDTEATTGSKVVLLHWVDLYDKISQEDYPEFTRHSNPEVRILDDELFPNIQRSNLHSVAGRTPVLPCIETLGWIIDHADTVKCTINNE